MMASSSSLLTTTDANCVRITTPSQDLIQHQHYSSSPSSSRYLSNSSCDDRQNDSRFQQQQPRIYSQGRTQQELQQLPYNSSNCSYLHQSGGNQICSRGETNEEQLDVGAFIYQAIQTDNVPIVGHAAREPDAQSMGHHEQQDLIQYSSELLDEQPIYENQAYSNQQIHSNNNDLISVRCFNNNNNNNNNENNNSNSLDENDSYYKFSSSSQVSASADPSVVHYYQDTTTTTTTQDDWKKRSLLAIESLGGDNKTSFTTDSNNNNNQQHQLPFQDQYQVAQFAQDAANNNNYTSTHTYDSSYHHVEEPTCFVSQQFTVQQSGYPAHQQQIADHHFVTTGPADNGSIISDQSCFPSSGDNSSPSSFQSIDQLQPTFTPTSTSATSSKSKAARRKNPATLSKVNGKLWEFIRDLLLSDRTNPAFIRWERREDGVFKFVQSNKVAKMWGERKQNPKMTYEKLSRAMRYYYKSKVLLPVFGRRLVYKFGPNASGWNKTG